MLGYIIYKNKIKQEVTGDHAFVLGLMGQYIKTSLRKSGAAYWASNIRSKEVELDFSRNGCVSVGPWTFIMMPA